MSTHPHPPPSDPSAQRFLSCARSYGAARSRWPTQDQTVYDCWAHTAWAQAELAAAQELDQWLDAGACGPAADGERQLQRTLQAAFAARPAPGTAGPPLPRRQLPPRWLGQLVLGAGLVSCSLGGFFLGFEQAVQAAALGPLAGPNAPGQDLAGLDPMLARWQAAFAESRRQAGTPRRSPSL